MTVPRKQERSCRRIRATSSAAPVQAIETFFSLLPRSRSEATFPKSVSYKQPPSSDGLLRTGRRQALPILHYGGCWSDEPAAPGVVASPISFADGASELCAVLDLC